jgi:hypothetical protein
MPELTWREDDSGAHVLSEEKLDSLLDRLDAEGRRSRPLIATLAFPDGRSLGIGLGGDEALLNATGRDGMPPYFVSDSGDVDETPVVFYFHGHYSEFPARQLVPRALARAAMRHFFRTGELSYEVSWREI